MQLHVTITCEVHFVDTYPLLTVCKMRVVLIYDARCMMQLASQALRDPSTHGKVQVKSNTMTCTPRNNSCVPNQIAEMV